ncbi:MAG TPA: class I adenylate-forming enzyme family protein, partial [Pyrinomonadaceae bacterium]|nr:class I adenylate-forming enzyme family protein [Pyrinomonadaceae bacterium]
MSGQERQAGRGSVLSYLADYARRGDEIVFAHVRGLRTVRWSYGRLASAAHRFARELERRNVRAGERVLLCGENCAEWAAAFWGCLLRGAVVVPLDKESTPDFILSVQRQTDAKLFVSGDDAPRARLEIPRLRLESLEDEVARHDDAPYTCADVSCDTLAEIIFTSGTTRSPKGVMITHRNLLANLAPLEAEIAKYVRWERLVHPLRFLSLVPLSHVFGQFMGLFVPQLVGGEVHFQDSLKPAEVARAARRRGVSVIALVPRMLDGLRDWVERDYEARGHARELQAKLARAAGQHFVRRWLTFRRVHNLFGWKFWAFVCGGATLDEATETFWRRTGLAVLQGYGMTETTSLITVTHPFKQSRGSVGRRLPGSEFKLDETGEIMVRGASVSPGYWHAEGGTASPADGWLRTGDIGEVDEAGNLYFKGRKKDVIVTAAGLNIFPDDLEAVLKRRPEVRDCCVVEWKGAGGAEPLAVLIMRAGEASAETVVNSANQQLADFQQIRRWHVWTGPDFPRTATHKVVKREVAATVSAQLEGETPRAGGRSFILAEAARL